MPPLCSETFDASARVTFNRRRPSRNRCDVMGLFAAPVNHSKGKGTRRVTTVMLLNAVADTVAGLIGPGVANYYYYYYIKVKS